MVIVDDGKGMSFDDFEQKWMFVAYSAKRDGSEDLEKGPASFDYRERLKVNPAYAGSKGIGRFSCDRLGAHLTLQTKPSNQKSITRAEISWSLFEANQEDEFVDVPVAVSRPRAFVVPSGVEAPEHGTVLTIRSLRTIWDRDKLLKLRAHLAKLINPFDGTPSFKIVIHAQSERVTDKQMQSLSRSRGEETAAQVNGPIQNFIFGDLSERTTFIEVKVLPDVQEIESRLVDRGKLIYHTTEPNPFEKLNGSKFECRLFYLNLAAKIAFSRKMGIPSVEFGSVFLFRNGFRIFPIGEEGEDTFGIDRRKQQGYARYVGTRDIIGRIDVRGNDSDFRESTSRNDGLIETPAYEELKECFMTYCLKRLERYVVGVTWQDKLDKQSDDASRLTTTEARGRIIEIVSSLVDMPNVKLLEYAPDLIDIAREKIGELDAPLRGLQRIAERSGDNELASLVSVAHKRFREAQAAEALARKEAERQRDAAKAAEARASHAEHALDEERKQNLFLVSVATLDRSIVEDLHHQVIIYATDLETLAKRTVRRIGAGQATLDEAKSALESILIRNNEILAASRLATKANFRMQADQIEEDLAEYIVQYLVNVCALVSDVKVHVSPAKKVFRRKFRPIALSIILENLVSNAKKAKAPNIYFELNFDQTGILELSVSDDGHGLAPEIDALDRIFELGFTRTKGSGIGLYQLKRYLEEMGGSVSVQKRKPRGTSFLIRIPK